MTEKKLKRDTKLPNAADIYEVVIVGGGCAGLFCAAMINEIFPKGLKVLLIEKTKSVGNKLLLSGSGQCNFTNADDMKKFSEHYGEGYSFVKKSFYHTVNQKLIELFEGWGVKSVIRDDLKVFPASLRADDIKNTLVSNAKKYPVEIKTEHELVEIEHLSKQIQLKIKYKDKIKIFTTKYLILCTGGASYPETGSTGDITRLLGKFDVLVIPFSPALSVPIISPILPSMYSLVWIDKVKTFDELSGISMNMTFSLWRSSQPVDMAEETSPPQYRADKMKKILTRTGALQFTHKGLSGPLILDNSRYFEQGDRIVLYLTKLTCKKEFEKHLIVLIDKYNKRMIRNIVSCLEMPANIINFLVQYVDARILNTKASELSREARKTIVERFFSMEFIIVKLGDINKAMCSKGGVDLFEINPHNMSLKKMPNIFVAGECIDIDGDTGGYNIHAAFATANQVAKYLANKNRMPTSVVGCEDD